MVELKTTNVCIINRIDDAIIVFSDYDKTFQDLVNTGINSEKKHVYP